MARLFSSGFELNSLTNGVEVTTNTSAAISSAHVRSGSYALRVNAVANAPSAQHQFSAASITVGTVFSRAYIYIASLPAANAVITSLLAGASAMCHAKLTTTGTLQLLDSNGAQVGSDSFTLSVGVWYRIELKNTASTHLSELRVNGFITAAADTLATNGANIVRWGVPGGSSTYDVYFDDVAINDSTGSFQNSYPGEGSIVHLLPNGAGDSTQWTPLASTNVSQVSEVTPDDATSYISSAVNAQSDLYNITDPSSVGLHPTSTINLVAVGGRFANDVADATTAFKFQIEKTASGTVSQSAAIIPNSTTYATNATTVPKNYPISLYQDPDNINWTKDTLFRTQIGALMTAVGVNAIRLSTIWALVEYVPTAGIGNYGPYLSVGSGMSRSEVAN